MRSIAIIQDEHRSLGAVLHGMRNLVRQIRDKGAAPDFELLGAMIYYIDRLKLEHRAGAEKIRILEQALLHYRQGGKVEFPQFLAALEAYATFHWAHMKTEENEILPLAERHLTAGDWEAIDAAFLGHTDPLLGVEAGAKYDALFSRIVNLVPLPVGVGPARRPA